MYSLLFFFFFFFFSPKSGIISLSFTGTHYLPRYLTYLGNLRRCTGMGSALFASHLSGSNTDSSNQRHPAFPFRKVPGYLSYLITFLPAYRCTLPYPTLLGNTSCVMHDICNCCCCCCAAIKNLQHFKSTITQKVFYRTRPLFDSKRVRCLSMEGKKYIWIEHMILVCRR